MAESPFPRVEFIPDGIPTSGGSGTDPTASPSPSSALARFEFEPGKGNEATKILMVEWEDESDEEAKSGDWEVSWEGKTTVLSARDGAEDKLHRMYFLLGPGVSIPPVVKLAQTGGKVIQTNPLPAIFPPELGASATTAGKLGVLHTVWAKKRLSVLQREIDAEMKTNGEGIGLEMAMQEKQWIEDNFGVFPRVVPELNFSTSSPRSPGEGRLSEKLRGLKLGTNVSALTGAPVKDESAKSEHPLSPDLGDVAVSSFALFHGATARSQSRTIVQTPPNFVVAAQQGDSRGGHGINSLDAITRGDVPKIDENETEDGLFAVRLKR